MVLDRCVRCVTTCATISLWAGVAFAGVVIPPVITPSPSPLSFPSQRVGTTSAPHTETYTVSGGSLGTAMQINSISATGDFAVAPGGTCATGISNAVPNTGSCTVFVSFTPTAVGTRNGTLTLNCTTVVFVGGAGFTCSISGSDLIVSLLGNGFTLAASIPTLSSFALALLSCALIVYAFLGLKRRRA